MPSTQITFVKIKMELLEDHRFLIGLNSRQKGLFLMLLALAGKTENKIPNNPDFIRGRLALLDITVDDLIEDLCHISKVFSKFRLINDLWIFEDFEKHHNYVFGSSKGVPEEFQKNSQKKKKKENKKEKEKKNKRLSTFVPPTNDEIISFFKTEGSFETEALSFRDYYQSNGWRVGRAAQVMKDWQAAARGWIRRAAEFGRNGSKPDTDVDNFRTMLRISK